MSASWRRAQQALLQLAHLGTGLGQAAVEQLQALALLGQLQANLGQALLVGVALGAHVLEVALSLGNFLALLAQADSAPSRLSRPS